VGSIVPILTILVSPAERITQVTIATALVVLLALGGLSAYAGGASLTRGALRMFVWGALAMGLTALVGHLFGTVI